MNPKDHPNAYVGLSTGAITAFLIKEAKTRLGVDLTVEEAGYIVTAVVALFFFFSKRLSGKFAGKK